MVRSPHVHSRDATTVHPPPRYACYGEAGDYAGRSRTMHSGTPIDNLCDPRLPHVRPGSSAAAPVRGGQVCALSRLIHSGLVGRTITGRTIFLIE